MIETCRPEYLKDKIEKMKKVAHTTIIDILGEPLLEKKRILFDMAMHYYKTAENLEKKLYLN